MSDTLLKVTDLKKYFPVRRGVLARVVAQVRAVDGVSFELKKGETLGLVGESGCGKTTCGRSILRLIEPTAGKIEFDGVNVADLRGQDLREMRKRMQIIFQDPYGSLNPRMTVGAIIAEGMTVHNMYGRGEREDKVKELLDTVGLNAAHINRYPHEFSGGQRQRIGIARALALNPDFIVCDEAVSALDVSIQAQVINLLVQLREDFDLSYLFIAHDLSVVEYISDRVAVMYLGQIVELATSEDLYARTIHPYSRALLSAIPKEHPAEKKDRQILEGDVPSPMNPPAGCRFHPRCPERMELCSKVEPKLLDYGDGHLCACIVREKQMLGKMVSAEGTEYEAEAAKVDVGAPADANVSAPGANLGGGTSAGDTPNAPEGFLI